MAEDCPPRLEEAALDLYRACKEFVRTVEVRCAISWESYAQMKAAIAKAEGLDSQGGQPGGPLLPLASVDNRRVGPLVDTRTRPELIHANMKALHRLF